MSDKIIAAIIAAVAAIAVALITIWFNSRKPPKAQNGDHFEPSEAHIQSFRLGVIIASGLVASGGSSQSKHGTELSRGVEEAKMFATNIARQIKKDADSFDKETSFLTLNEALERFFKPPDMITYRRYYELGQTLCSLKIGSEELQTIKMSLNYMFVTCISDFPKPFSKLQLSEELQHCVAQLYEIQTRPSLGKKEIDEIAQQVNKVWIHFFGRKV